MAATRTVQDIFDEMTADQKDLTALVVGASVDDQDLPADQDMLTEYNALTAEQANFIDYIVGIALSNETSVTHSDDPLDNFLAHHGVKGMKWGVRRDSDSGGGRPPKLGVTPRPRGVNSRIPGAGNGFSRGAAKARVKSGTGTLGDAHIAALKTKGHRLTNAVLGDKTYWKRAFVIAGVTVAAASASVLVPGLLPAATLASIGAHTSGAAAALHLTGTSAAMVNAITGKAVLQGTGLLLTKTGNVAANTANVVTNTARAVRGNARIDKSYEKLGAYVSQSQRNGSERVQKILSRNGGIRKSRLRSTVKHSAIDKFLAEQGLEGMLSHADTADTSNLVAVVALPSALDPIRLVGDEDKHATLLFLGDKTTLSDDARQTMLDTVQLAAQMFTPFSEKITDVGRFGGNTPPALVAKLSNQNIGQLRNAFMVSPVVNQYLSNTPQFANYVPHVTIGYPDYQGEADLRNTMKNLYRVKFDRLALWWGDEKTEFDMNVSIQPDSYDGESDVAWSDDMLGNFLAHHGIKGMKWGIRRNLDSSGGGTSGGAGDASTSSGGNSGGSSGGGSSSGAAHEIPTTAEMKAAVDRARTIKDYNKLFGNPNDHQLKAAVDRMELQKKYIQLNQELTPEKHSMVKSFANTVSAGYNAYSTIDKATGGALSKGVVKKLGLKEPVSELEALTGHTKLIQAKANSASARATLIRSEKTLADLLPKPVPGSAPGFQKGQLAIAKTYAQYAKDSVKDAKELNDILADVLKD